VFRRGRLVCCIDENLGVSMVKALDSTNGPFKIGDSVRRGYELGVEARDAQVNRVKRVQRQDCAICIVCPIINYRDERVRETHFRFRGYIPYLASGNLLV
jgi:hypothetical protein